MRVILASEVLYVISAYRVKIKGCHNKPNSDFLVIRLIISFYVVPYSNIYAVNLKSIIKNDYKIGK